MEKTIMQIGMLGNERAYTREEYVRIWKNHASDLVRLADTSDEWNEIETMRNRIEELANKNFDRIYTSQNK